eukprot:m.192050 g.192050  ORF g.192050 m.192050 type:complete len:395 (-) comp17581_c1_seq3:2075-3259(-)
MFTIISFIHHNSFFFTSLYLGHGQLSHEAVLLSEALGQLRHAHVDSQLVPQHQVGAPLNKGLHVSQLRVLDALAQHTRKDVVEDAQRRLHRVHKLLQVPCVAHVHHLVVEGHNPVADALLLISLSDDERLAEVRMLSHKHTHTRRLHVCQRHINHLQLQAHKARQQKAAASATRAVRLLELRPCLRQHPHHKQEVAVAVRAWRAVAQNAQFLHRLLVLVLADLPVHAEVQRQHLQLVLVRVPPQQVVPHRRLVRPALLLRHMLLVQQVLEATVLVEEVKDVFELAVPPQPHHQPHHVLPEPAVLVEENAPVHKAQNRVNPVRAACQHKARVRPHKQLNLQRHAENVIRIRGRCRRTCSSTRRVCRGRSHSCSCRSGPSRRVCRHRARRRRLARN